MTNKTVSNKPKARLTTQPLKKIVLNQKTSRVSIKSVKKSAVQKAAATLPSRSGAQLAKGTELFTAALSSYVTSLDGSVYNDAPLGFQEAYSSFIHAVPAKSRPVLLRRMRSDIDAVAMKELNIAPDDLAENNNGNRVSTADFMAGLMQQETEQRKKDIAAGRLLSGAQIKARLNVTSQALSAALKAKRMFVLQGLSGEYVYPAFFSDSKFDRPVLERICKLLGDLPGAAKWDFFTSPRLSLKGKNPLDALANGRLDEVINAANAFREE